MFSLRSYFSNTLWKKFDFSFISDFVPRIYGLTADEVVQDLNLENKQALITGANSGIGLEMLRCLSGRGCEVIMACRNTYAANVAAKNVAATGVAPTVYELNLASLKSVKKCADEISNDKSKLDIVILNAGVFGLPWSLTEDNIETTFQVNYLAQYYLLMNIEKILAADARVVFVTSESHRNVKWSMRDQTAPQEELVSLPPHLYTSIKAYNISKLCQLLTMHYLGYRWLKSGKSVYCANPGSFIKTGLCRNWRPYEVLYSTMQPFSKSAVCGAATPLYCATSPALRGVSAGYYDSCAPRHESELAQELQLAFRLHDLTADMIHARTAHDTATHTRTHAHSERYRDKTANEQPLASNYST